MQSPNILALQSTDHFPNLAGVNNPSNSLSSSQGSVWGRGNTKNLFKRLPEQKKSRNIV